MIKTESKQLDNIFEAMAHGKRRGMLDTLAYRPATVSQLAQEFKLSLPAMHKHVRVLERARLIHRRKVGRVNFVALNNHTLGETQAWINKYQTAWGGDRQTLENYLASLQ